VTQETMTVAMQSVQKYQTKIFNAIIYPAAVTILSACCVA